MRVQDVPNVDVDSPWMTVDETFPYMRFPSAHALRQAVKRYGIPHIRRGVRLFFVKSEIDQFMKIATDATKPTRRRRRKSR